MYGWRGRVGLLAPSRGDTLLYEFYRTAPDGVMAVPYSCELTHLDRDQLARVGERYQEGVHKLAREQVDVISVGGTPPQILEGWPRAKQLIAQLRSSVPTPLVASSESEVAAVKAGAATRIAVLTPHQDELNERLVGVFKAEGIEVVAVRGMNLVNTVDIGMISSAVVYRKVLEFHRELADDAIDGIHITCPRWPTIDILAPLEEVLGVPVTSGSAAQLWAAFGALGLSPRAGAWGSLLQHRTS